MSAMVFMTNAQCTDEGVDSAGDGCEWYAYHIDFCGEYDTDEWSANDACCACTPKEKVDSFLTNKVRGENFNKFIVIKDSKNGPKLQWVSIGESDLQYVEILNGLSDQDIVFILPSKSLFDYQKRFKERVNASFSFG